MTESPTSRGTSDEVPVDVLVVGAGPTGLTLAAQLVAFGASVRVVDAKAGPVAESRALAIQPRTLEVLRGSVTGRLLERGNQAVQLRWHAGGRTAVLPLFDMGMDDTAYPFLLFLSQAETEAALVEHLEERGVGIEWNTRLDGYDDDPDQGAVRARIVDVAGSEHTVRARYLAGCDGAHSEVRRSAGIPFTGGRYPQTFLLADLEATGLEPDAAHVWLGAGDPLFFFPLRTPAAWRMLTPRPGGQGSASEGEGVEGEGVASAAEPVETAELQQVVEAATGGRVRLAAPVWSTAFRIHHRHAATYRAGRAFLAGDAAHIHSPAGAQGMNTGIQDAVNLGWKLALVCRGRAPETLLDTYDAERRPVGAFVLRFTDRAFTAATSTAPVVRFARTHLAPRALTVVAHLPRLRAVAFHVVSQLSIRYPDLLGTGTGPVVGAGPGLRRRVRARLPGPRPGPGERLPDVRVRVAGQDRWLHDCLTEPGFHLLLCGPSDRWDETALGALRSGYGDLVRVHRLTRQPGHPDGGVLLDVDGSAGRRLGVRHTAYLLVRPDGHVALRRQGSDLTALTDFLSGLLTTG